MRALRTFALLALALLEGGCGLPSSYYLAPPIQGPGGLDPTAGTFQISSPSNYFESEFRGFELYYKFYANAPSGSEISLGGSSNDVTTLTNAGFRTVCSGDASRDSSPDVRILPLIPIAIADRSAALTITINVNPKSMDPGSVNYSYTTSALETVTVQIDRHVRGSPSGCKPFTFNGELPNNYSTDDADVQGVMGIVTANTIYLAMYAVSYGLQDASSPIYSYPVYLGYLMLTSF